MMMPKFQPWLFLVLTIAASVPVLVLGNNGSAALNSKVVEVSPSEFQVLGAGFTRLGPATFANTTRKNGSQLSDARFLVWDAEFRKIIGANPNVTLLAEMPGVKFAHEAPVFLPETNEIFFASNRLTGDDGKPRIDLWKVNIETGNTTQVFPNPPIPMANGAARLPQDHPTHPGWIIVNAQGYGDDQPAGLVLLDPVTWKSEYLLDNFFGTPFNSPNDVVITSDGGIFFTDPPYGAAQGFRPAPRLGANVYYFHPNVTTVRLAADGFAKPNGLELSRDGKTLFVTDTGSATGTGAVDEGLPHTIYAYDIKNIPADASAGGPDLHILENRRVFAYTGGFPDGLQIHPDTGSLFAGTGDGISVFNEAGTLIGDIILDGGAAQMHFAGPKVLLIMHETEVLRVDFDVT